MCIFSLLVHNSTMSITHLFSIADILESICLFIDTFDMVSLLHVSSRVNKALRVS